MNSLSDLTTTAGSVRPLAQALEAAGAKLATAESCTGGLIAAALTELAGSSGWFERGFVTYSNESKHELLGVRLETLAEHGAVSEAVAAQMAEGALARSRTALALAVTGIAGPGGGSAAKPVGTVCFGWAVRRKADTESAASLQVVVETRVFAGDRQSVRLQTASYALSRALEIFADTGVGTAQAP
ncbi:MAG: nicotinamide-nucleotide amidohydrolase family protein [Betaproteobacteria bacterium]|nr:nicotinamide-nucleotide amidohydrolase family protein [Betaproteobacteria bacterium]